MSIAKLNLPDSSQDLSDLVNLRKVVFEDSKYYLPYLDYLDVSGDVYGYYKSGILIGSLRLIGYSEQTKDFISDFVFLDCEDTRLVNILIMDRFMFHPDIPNPGRYVARLLSRLKQDLVDSQDKIILIQATEDTVGIYEKFGFYQYKDAFILDGIKKHVFPMRLNIGEIYNQCQNKIANKIVAGT